MTVPFLSLLPFILAALLLMWVRPEFGLLTPLVFHASYLLRTHLTVAQWTLPTTLLEVLLVVAVLCGLARVWGDKSVRREYWEAGRALPRRLLVLVALFTVAATVSVTRAPHPQTAWGHWKAFIIEPIVYTTVLLPTLRAPGGRRRLAAGLLLGGLVSAGLSLAAPGVELLRPYSLHTAPSALTSDFFRLRGIYDVPNSLTLVLAPLSTFAVVLACAPRAAALRRLARWSLALFLPVLLFTQSLGGVSAATLTVLLFVSLTARAKVIRYTTSLARAGWSVRLRGATVVLVGVTLVLLLGLGLQLVSGKITHARALNSPFHARLQIWSVSHMLIRDHPILGTGLGTFEPAYQAKLRQLVPVRSPSLVPSSMFPLEWLVRDPHNVLFSFWLNTGLVGLLSMGSLLVIALRHSLPAAPNTPHAAAGAALLCLLLFGLVDVPYFKNDLSLLWWTFLVLALTVPHGGVARPSE